jgi:hypothetical protein
LGKGAFVERHGVIYRQDIAKLDLEGTRHLTAGHEPDDVLATTAVGEVERLENERTLKGWIPILKS